MSSTTNTKMYVLKVGNVDVYVPAHLNNVPCNDWENYASYMVDGWSETEEELLGMKPMSNEDWLAFYTYIDKETGRYIFNGKQTWPTHLKDKYVDKEAILRMKRLYGDSDSDSD